MTTTNNNATQPGLCCSTAGTSSTPQLVASGGVFSFFTWAKIILCTCVYCVLCVLCVLWSAQIHNIHNIHKKLCHSCIHKYTIYTTYTKNFVTHAYQHQQHPPTGHHYYAYRIDVVEHDKAGTVSVCRLCFGRQWGCYTMRVRLGPCGCTVHCTSAYCVVPLRLRCSTV